MATQFLQIKGGKIAYEESGSGPLVICAPSMGDLRQEYRFLIPHLTAAGYRAVSLDVRGHGESSPDWTGYSVGDVGSDLLKLASFLGDPPVVFIGCSMAGGAAVWAAAEAPHLVRGLVLIDPFVRGGGDWQGNLLYSLLFARPWGTYLWLSYYKTLYPTRQPEDFSKYCGALRANLSQHGRLEALGHMLRASKKASEQRLEKVSAPALVLMGSKDRDFKDPESEARWVAESLHARYAMIPDAGHYPHAEMSDLTAQLILQFLKELSYGPGV